MTVLRLSRPLHLSSECTSSFSAPRCIKDLPARTQLWEEFTIDATPHTPYTLERNGKAENIKEVIMRLARSCYTDVVIDLSNGLLFRKLLAVIIL